MKILAIDTSGIAASVCIWNEKPLYTSTTLNKNTHSLNLMPMIKSAFDLSNINVREIDYIAVVNGPGSFTGVRIGVSTAKGIAQGLNVPCIGISSLEALAFSVFESNHLICPILDARSQQVYASAYRYSSPPIKIIEEEALKLIDYIDNIKVLSESFIFIGDGSISYKEHIISLLGNRAHFFHEEFFYPNIALVAKLATFNIHKAQHYYDIMPLYLRAPQAERMLQEGSLKPL